MANVLTTTNKYHSHRHRYNTYSTRDYEEPRISAIALASAGFVLEEQRNLIKCPWCCLELRNLNFTHHPLTWHRVLSSPVCPFVKNNRHVNLRDLGILFPDVPPSTADLGNLILRSTRDDGNNDDVEMASSESQGDGHLTILNDIPENTDDAPPAPPTTSEELNRYYQDQNQLRLLLPKKDIDNIRATSAQIESVLSAFTSERYRKSTFVNWSKRDISTTALAASGFVYLQGTEDTVECVYCKIHLKDWTAEMIPDDVHRKKSVHCQYMQGSRSVKNTPDVLADLFDDSLAAPANESLGIITESSKHPEFAVETRRKGTFLTWPSSNHKLASEMIEHDLFYTGLGDVVCCFSCGTEMSGWNATDNIWRRHARQTPHCQLVLREKGPDWVDAIIEQYGRFVEPEREPSVTSVTTRMLRPRMDNLATQNVLQMVNPEYPREEVRSALIQNIKYGGADYITRRDIIKAILKRRDDRRKLEVHQRTVDAQPPPPEIVVPPRRPGENENIPVIGPRTVLLASIHRDEPSTSGMESYFAAAAAAAADDANEESHSMESEPTVSNAPVSHRTLTPPPTPAANPMDLARIMKAQLTCKICMDAPVGIAFLPCGHMVCCPSCAPAMVQCPLCRQDVRGTVRVYLDKL